MPSDAFTPSAQDKRSVPAAQLARRDPSWSGDFLHVGDKPWYCYWNSTINEFWVFLGQDMNNGTSSSSTTASITSVASTTSKVSPHGTSAASPTHPTQATSSVPVPTTPHLSEPTGPGAYWPSSKAENARRQASTTIGPTDFPKMVKMVEKRKPGDNVQPYCQQMQVLNNWQIVPIPTVSTIDIEESEYSAAAATAGSKRFMNKRSMDTVQQLGSNCICEWFSG